VSGRGGMKLYANGVLVGTDTNTGSFAWIGGSAHNYLGRSNWRESLPNLNEDFQGQMDEVRVWKVARTVEQIRGTMFENLTGTEPGLVGLWNFETVEDGLVKDSTPGAHHGKLIGSAKVVEARLPDSARLARIHQVLRLDGTNSFVELPPGIFNELDEATVEGWVKWESFRNMSRFFDFGEAWHSINVQNRERTPNLQFEIATQPGLQNISAINIPGLLRPNEWCHVAAVSGKLGMKLYFNGVLVGTHAYGGSFAATQSGQNAYLGRAAWGFTSDEDFHGQMNEVRVWKVARTEEQIQENMFRQMTGTEPALAAVWNFARVENGFVRDAGPGAHHGRLIGNAKVVGARLPDPAELPKLERVLDLDGTNSFVQLPPNLFNDLTETTVEAWVKRNPASPGSRFFSYGEYLHDGGLEIQADGTLRFFLEDATAGMQNLTGVPGFSATSGFMRHSCPGLKE